MEQIKSKFETIFVTGGAGYIGSHCVVELLEAGYQVIACDNFSNSVQSENASDPNKLPPSLERVEELTGKKIIFYSCDLVDYQQLDNIFRQVINIKIKSFLKLIKRFKYLCLA
jgi:UDP-glucose 4-epimerase